MVIPRQLTPFWESSGKSEVFLFLATNYTWSDPKVDTMKQPTMTNQLCIMELGYVTYIVIICIYCERNRK